MAEHTQIVVVGAGYAGVAATRRILQASPRTSVTVVNPREVFVERVRLHQMVAGTAAATTSLREILHPGAQLKVGAVDRIEPDARRAVLNDGTAVDYDYLIYAAGSRSRPEAIDGADAHGWSVAEYEDARRLRDRIGSLPTRSTVTVIGGGLTGLESATEIAEQRPDLEVVLVSRDAIASSLSDAARAKVSRVLDELGITTIPDAVVTSIDESKVVLADGRHLATDCPVVTASFVASALARNSGLTTDMDGRLSVHPDLVSESSSHIVGAGDAMSLTGNPLRMSCQAAIPLGTHAAETTLALIDGKRPKPVAPKFVGRCISLGRRDAVFQRTDRHDRLRPWSIGGRPGAFVKEQIASSTVNFALDPKIRLSYSWS